MAEEPRNGMKQHWRGELLVVAVFYMVLVSGTSTANSYLESTSEIAIRLDESAFMGNRVGQETSTTVTIDNIGSSSVTVERAGFPIQSPFSIPDSQIVGTTLAVGEQIEVTISFHPMEHRAYVDILEIDFVGAHSGVENCRQTKSTVLFGQGFEIVRLPTEPGFIDFGTVAIGDQPIQSVVVTNPTPAEIIIDGLTISAATNQFAIFAPTWELPITLGPEETVEVFIEAKPTNLEPHVATIIANTLNGDIELTTVRVNDCMNSALQVFDSDSDGFAICGGDCDDTSATVSPGAIEIADSIDNDCDGIVDEVGTNPNIDNDGDGFCAGTSCTDGSAPGDCHDGEPLVYPGAPERLNRFDDDCDQTIDETTGVVDDDGDGVSEIQGDCDDSDATVHPAASDTFWLSDRNCDGIVDFSYWALPDIDADGIHGDFDCDDNNPDLQIIATGTCFITVGTCAPVPNCILCPEQSGCTCRQSKPTGIRAVTVLILFLILGCTLKTTVQRK